MSQAYDERVARLAVASRILEEADLALQQKNRTLRDILDTNFRKIITASQTNPKLSGAILAAGFTFGGVATAMGSSLGVLGIVGGGASLLGLVGLPLLGPIGIGIYVYKKIKERQKREQLEKELHHAEKLALQQIIKKQAELIQALKQTMQEAVRKQDEMERNMNQTMNDARRKEERIKYLERLLEMMTQAGEAFGAGAA
ncbi:hypothetical protein SAMN02799630_05416 [Paenibacillus sp. UNCCL117]|uniref:hypothetical protein n=1 Tax=unclassified Paenibacillus TaxID=185978 RepID=UPI00088E3BBE|nr:MULTISPECIES: hypothetical protein [unclassified Paenibacillus]SDE47212.1 hypothetical protein SAMN04488602_12950 [Paenibacillus sp. cl123]SFW65734.1 hypothetical protein SAMN02799630_05416 [Paenibacillus sp. UNCCL117]